MITHNVDLEDVLRKVMNAAACCSQLAENQGMCEQANALYFLSDGLKDIANNPETLVDAELKERAVAKGAGPVAVT